MLCQYCQKPISLLRRLSDTEFCSPQHRESYEREQSALAISRLQERPTVRPTPRLARPTAAAAAAPLVSATAVATAPQPSVLAGLAAWPQRQNREYWAYALPAEPLPAPLGVMLLDTGRPWSQPAPLWGTTVVAVWPKRLSTPLAAQSPLPVSSRAPAIPNSALQPMTWERPNVPAAEDPPLQESLIGLSILPGWSLPQPLPPALAPLRTTVFHFSPAHPKPTAGQPASATVLPVAGPPPRSGPWQRANLPIGPAAAKVTCLWTMSRPWPNLQALVAAEEQNYQIRLERRLIAVAEQAGLSELVAPATLSARGQWFGIAGTAVPVPLAMTLAWPALAQSMAPIRGLSAGSAATLPSLSPRPLPVLAPASPVNEVPFPRRPLAERSHPAIDHQPDGASHPLAVTPPLAQRSTAALELSSAAEPMLAPLAWPASRQSQLAIRPANGLQSIPAPAPRIIPTATPEPASVATPNGFALTPREPADLLRRSARLTLFPLSGPVVALARPGGIGAVSPLNAPAIVVVLESPKRPASRRTGLHEELFSLASLFPSRRDHASHLNPPVPSPWRLKPVWLNARLPRISLRDKNATRAISLPDVRQALQKQTIERARRFWKLAPADLKWLAFGLPLILGFWLWPSTPVRIDPAPPAPKVASTSPAKGAEPTSFLEKAIQNNLDFGGFEARIANRASIHLEEDFSAGLGHWEGDGNWARSWSYDKGGVVRPGRMAIYQPSIPMTDYTFELTAAVERRSVSWMVRATNLRNYVAARLNVSPGTSGQRLSFERWTVKDGRVTRRQALPLSTTLGNATTLKLRMEVNGSTFATSLQDQVIDVFTDTTHPSGGVGLFSGDSDQPRIYRIELTHQHDFFGKLCSFFAPHPITKLGTISP